MNSTQQTLRARKNFFGISEAEHITPKNFCRYQGVIALQSTRNGGISDGAYCSLNLGRNTNDVPEIVQQNIERLCTTIGITSEQLVSSEQVHGTEILYAEKPGRSSGYDAFITDKEDLFLCIFTADCFPVLLYDPRHKASGAAHAGWKGTADHIVTKTIAAMQNNFDSIPEECIAYIGTGISADAYEVDPTVASAFPADCIWRSSATPNEKYLLDLRRANYNQLRNTGIPASNIECSPFCSFKNSDLFYSYRRDHGETGRMVSLIGVKSNRDV